MNSESPPAPIARPGRNCHGVARARRVAFLIDAESYYAVVADAIGRARRSVFIIGWDFDPYIHLRRDREGGRTDQLGEVLNRAVEEQPNLHVHVLVWDFSLFFAIEHRPFKLGKVRWKRHERVHLIHDSIHPLGASHHQKMVVIDDSLAFVGGIDLTVWRWDTTRHEPDDPRRTNLGGRVYPPFHDLMMMVDGDAAARVGSLARERWSRVAGEEPPEAVRVEQWPDHVPADLADVDVAVARTDPGAQEGTVREIEALHLDVIARARRYLYIENQYLTASRLVKALLARLGEEDGPEIVIVTPMRARGWIVRHTLDYMREKVVEELHQSDGGGRLRLFYPAVGAAGEQVYVHAKLLIADDEIVRVGSANLSNRSMNVDTELDLMVEAGGRDDVRRSVRGLRDRLVAEHLGATPEEVARAVDETGSLIQAIDRLNHRDHRLAPIPDLLPHWAYDFVPDVSPFDPEMPLTLHRLYEHLMNRHPDK